MKKPKGIIIVKKEKKIGLSGTQTADIDVPNVISSHLNNLTVCLPLLYLYIICISLIGIPEGVEESSKF